MNLFEILKLSSDCYLCGCPVTPEQSAPHNSSVNSPIICHCCHQLLPRSSNTCISCGLPLTNTTFNQFKENNQTTPLSAENIPCGECLKQSPPFDKTLSGFHYQAPISEFITQLKYSAQFQLLPLLCDYLMHKIIEHYQNKTLPDALVPVPLHPDKQIERGYNQSQLIAKQVARALNLKVISDNIKRIKHTKAQSGLDSVERKSNVKNAFSIDTQLPHHIAIIDDVVTTGTTVSELAKQARLAGAIQIDVWCLARAYDL